jgi:hypothetical protein
VPELGSAFGVAAQTAISAECTNLAGSAARCKRNAGKKDRGDGDVY